MADTSKHFHFVGICGTAMGSVAAAMKQRGHTITGSDSNVYPPMSTFLLDQGVEITSGFAAENIPASADQVIIGNAISRGNEEAEAVLERKLLYVSLPEILKTEFLRGKSNHVVAGTHGKTTTTSLLAWIMLDGGLDPSFMIGGLPKNLGVGAQFTESQHTVLEGDEYDTAFFDKRSKFLHYLPEVVIINNIEFDHADIYDSLDEIKLSFRRLLNIVPRNGIAFINGDDANCIDVASSAPAPVQSSRLWQRLRLPANGRHLFGNRFSLYPCRRALRSPHGRRVQCQERSDGCFSRTSRRTLPRKGSRVPGQVRRHCPSSGGQRHRAGRSSHRRLRPSPNRNRPGHPGNAQPVSQREDLGSLRAAIEHLPEKHLSERTRRGPSRSRWLAHFPRFLHLRSSNQKIDSTQKRWPLPSVLQEKTATTSPVSMQSSLG